MILPAQALIASSVTLCDGAGEPPLSGLAPSPLAAGLRPLPRPVPRGVRAMSVPLVTFKVFNIHGTNAALREILFDRLVGLAADQRQGDCSEADADQHPGACHCRPGDCAGVEDQQRI